MKIIADLHTHSKHSMACSKQLTPENNELWCRHKGIDVLATADFTHPAWFKELREKLEEQEQGLYKLKNTDSPVRFLVATEVACIYKQGDKCRRQHVCILVPSLETAEKINKELSKRKFNIKSDGRPILGLSVKNLTAMVLEIEPNSLIIPAHIWTPWFALFGSKSGFDSIEECFEEYTPYIYAVETGISSDPEMNWRLSALDNITLLSNSDAHSPANFGREANVFDIDKEKLSYNEIARIIKEKDKDKFLYTIEFFPEEGRYHIDGHSKCNYSCRPQESKKQKNICPVCKKELVLGVEHRIDDLADIEKNKIDISKHIPYKSLIPLAEIISDSVGVGKNSKKVQTEYFNMVKNYPELKILIDLTENELKTIANPEITRGIINVRNKNVEIVPGFDGNYGKIKIFNDGDKPEQKNLF